MLAFFQGLQNEAILGDYKSGQVLGTTNRGKYCKSEEKDSKQGSRLQIGSREIINQGSDSCKAFTSRTSENCLLEKKQNKAMYLT